MTKAAITGETLLIQPDYYVIRVKEYLPPDWSEWFEGLTVVNTAAGETLLSGCIPDQSALHGLLARIRDLNLTLISVSRVEQEHPVVAQDLLEETSGSNS